MYLETVNQVLDWYERNEVREFAPTALRERQRLWKLFRIAYGAHEVGECRPADLLAFIVSQKGCRSNHTRRRIRATICRPFNEAECLGLISRSPFRGIRIPKGKSGRDWTDAEFQAILRVSAPYFRRLICFVRFSGARPGEARTLEWPHVRYEVEAIIQAVHKTDDAVDQPRRIYFNRVFLRLLIWLRRHKTHNTFVFTNRRGRPWTIRALCNHMAIIRQRAGLARDVKNHGGRHTFGTNAIMNGVDLAELAQLLGHTNVNTTMRYVHLANKRGHLNDASERAIRKRKRA